VPLLRLNGCTANAAHVVTRSNEARVALNMLQVGGMPRRINAHDLVDAWTKGISGEGEFEIAVAGVTLIELGAAALTSTGDKDAKITTKILNHCHDTDFFATLALPQDVRLSRVVQCILRRSKRL
jgi:hypothetical protein